MKNTKTLIFTVAIILFTLPKVEATNYYVATNGSDYNNGTSISTPYLTIAKAMTNAIYQGDSILIRGGTYYPTNELLYWGVSGTAIAPIVITVYRNEHAIVDGTSLPAATNIFCIAGNSNYIKIRNLEIRKATKGGITIWEVANNISIEHNTVYNCTNNGIAVLRYNGGGSSFIKISHNVIYNCQESGIIVDGYDDTTKTKHIIIDSNIVYNNVLSNVNHTNSSWPGGLSIGKCERVTVFNNTVYNNNGEGLLGYLINDCVFDKNIAYDNFSANLYIDNAKNCLYERNLIYNITGSASGIQAADETTYSLSNLSANNTIINNIVIGCKYGLYFGNYNGQGGINTSWKMNNITVANNTIYGASNAIIHINNAYSSHSNSSIINNIFYRTGTESMVESLTVSTGIAYNQNCWYGANAGILSGSSDVTANPLLINPGTHNASDYKLQSLSPCIDAGTIVASVLVDFDSIPRIAPYDIGAFEKPLAINAPPAPVAIAATNIIQNSFSANWNSAATASGYFLDVSENNSFSSFITGFNNKDVGNVISSPVTGLAADTPYYYRVRAYNSGGTSGNSNTIITTTGVTPVAYFSASITSGCTPLTVNFFDESTGSPSSWAWDIDNNGIVDYTIKNPSHTYSIAGNYSVKLTVTNSLGSDSKTVTNLITVNPFPASAGTISGNTTVCQGSSNTYSIGAVSGATSYTWTLPSGWTGSSTTTSITATAGSAGGTISVTANNSCGSSTPRTLAITVSIKPNTPLISLNGYVLHSDASLGNQWYNQSGLINGATNQDYTVSVNGNYYVIVTLLGCSSAASNILNVVLTGIEVPENNKTIKVYPNPVSNKLIIEIEGNSKRTNFEIYNAIGQVVFKENLVEKTTVQTSNFAPGVYLIKLENGKTFEFKKIIKE